MNKGNSWICNYCGKTHGKVERDIRGVCQTCGSPVFADQDRKKDDYGKYWHTRCLAEEEDDDDNDDEEDDEEEDDAPAERAIRGMCATCHEPVFTDQDRTKDDDGNYWHTPCAELEEEKDDDDPNKLSRGACIHCGKQVYTNQTRGTDGRSNYWHEKCGKSAPLVGADSPAMPSRWFCGECKTFDICFACVPAPKASLPVTLTKKNNDDNTCNETRLYDMLGVTKEDYDEL